MKRLSPSLFSLGGAPDPAVPAVLQCGFAGGSVHGLQEFRRLLPERQHVAVHYPGRGARSAEPLAPDVRAIASAAVADFAKLVADGALPPGPLLLGHSMGAYVALETAALLETRGIPCTALVVSSSLPPTDEPAIARRLQTLGGYVVADLDDEELARVLIAEGGLSEEMVSEPELLDLVLPILRHDFALGAAYATGGDAAVVSCPLIALAGEHDRAVAPGDMAGWRHRTLGRTDLWTFPGDHFWFRTCPPGVGDAIDQALAERGR